MASRRVDRSRPRDSARRPSNWRNTFFRKNGICGRLQSEFSRALTQPASSGVSVATKAIDYPPQLKGRLTVLAAA